MKVLLVQAHLGRKEPMLVYPLGLAYVGTSLRSKGHEVRGYDPNGSPEGLDGLRKRIAEFPPDVIGISLRNIDDQHRRDIFYYYLYFQETLRVVRDCTSHAKIVGGGPGFSIFAEKIMQRNTQLDFGIYLEGEESFPDLLDNIDNPCLVKGLYYRKDGEVVFSGERTLPDFEHIGYPHRDFFEMKDYQSDIQCVGIQTKRGCPFKCTYCTYPQLNGNRQRMRSAESVCDEVKYLIDNFNIKRIIFADAIFNSPKKHAEEICEAFIKRGIKIEWSAYMGIKNADKDFMLLAQKAGCRDVVFSPDGISRGALKSLNKMLEEKDIEESLRLFTKDKAMANFNVIYSFFLNAPGETALGLFKTLLFYMKAKLALRGRGNAFMNWIRLEPDTEAFKQAVEEGAIPKDIELLPDSEMGLAKVFYSRPSLKSLDPLLLSLLKLPANIKSIARIFSSKKHDRSL
jgi:radical SAM superfamily enzyme YgiQ (UPF0313 family)